DRDGTLLLAQRVDRGAETDRHGGRFARTEQDRMKDRPHDAQAGGPVRAQEARDLRLADDLACGIAGEMEIAVIEALLGAAVQHADGIERAQGRPAQRDAEAEHGPVAVLLDDLGVDSDAPQPRAERQPRDAAADDQDTPDAAHHSLPSCGAANADYSVEVIANRRAPSARRAG